MAVAFDAVNSSAGAGTVNFSPTTTLTYSHVVGSGANRYAIVGVAIGTSTSGAGAINSVTFGGTTMTSISKIYNNTSGVTTGFVQMFGLANPTSGTQSVVITLATAADINSGSMTFTGVASLGTPATSASAAATSTTLVVPASTSGNMIVDAVCCGGTISTSTQTVRWLRNLSGNTNASNGAGSTAAGTGSSVTMGYSGALDSWSMVGVELVQSSGATTGMATIALTGVAVASLNISVATRSASVIVDDTFPTLFTTNYGAVASSVGLQLAGSATPTFVAAPVAATAAGALTLTASATASISFATTATGSVALVGSANDALKFPATATAAVALSANNSATALVWPRVATAFPVLTALGLVGFTIPGVLRGSLTLTAAGVPTPITAVTAGGFLKVNAVGRPLLPNSYDPGWVPITHVGIRTPGVVNTSALYTWQLNNWQVSVSPVLGNISPTYQNAGKWSITPWVVGLPSMGYNSSNTINDSMTWTVPIVPGIWDFTHTCLMGPDRGVVTYDTSYDNGVTWNFLGTKDMYGPIAGTPSSFIVAPGTTVPGNGVVQSLVRLRVLSNSNLSSGYYMTNTGIYFYPTGFVIPPSTDSSSGAATLSLVATTTGVGNTTLFSSGTANLTMSAASATAGLSYNTQSTTSLTLGGSAVGQLGTFAAASAALSLTGSMTPGLSYATTGTGSISKVTAATPVLNLAISSVTASIALLATGIPTTNAYITRNGMNLVKGSDTSWQYVGFNSFDLISGCGVGAEVFTDAGRDAAFVAMRQDGRAVVRAWAFPNYSLASIDKIMASAAAANIKVILTLCDGAGGCGDSSGAAANPSTFFNGGWTGTYKSWLGQIVPRYSTNTSLLAWEVINEPNGLTTGILPFYQQATAYIRSLDSHHLISSGTQPVWNFASDGANSNSPWGGTNIQAWQSVNATCDIASMHEYDMSSAPSGWFPPTLAAAKGIGRPLMVGEFGIDTMSGTTRANEVEAKLTSYVNADTACCGALYWALNANVTGMAVNPADPTFTTVKNHFVPA